MKYRKVISGKTFDADVQLMHKVMGQVQGRVHFIESNEDAQTTIVFCPISSRVGSDVDAAMADVKGKGKLFQPVYIEMRIAYNLFAIWFLSSVFTL